MPERIPTLHILEAISRKLNQQRPTRRTHAVTDRLLAKLSAEVDGRAPYRIEAALLATPAAVSELGIPERYHLRHEPTGQGRIVTADLHDQRYVHPADATD